MFFGGGMGGFPEGFGGMPGGMGGMGGRRREAADTEALYKVTHLLFNHSGISQMGGCFVVGNVAAASMRCAQTALRSGGNALQA